VPAALPEDVVAAVEALQKVVQEVGRGLCWWAAPHLLTGLTRPEGTWPMCVLEAVT
jgi:hypothetical protein